MNKLETYGVFAVVALVAVAYISKKGAQAVQSVHDGVKTVGAAINPTNPGNVFYAGANSIGGVLTDSQEFNLGSWVYDVFHADPFAPPMNDNNTTGSVIKGVSAGSPNELLAQSPWLHF